jgi:pSer/pThr/pTyr-binding forkhead associated (FHA) protein
MARIVSELNGQVLKDYPFNKPSVTVGRRKDNAIVFSNLEVSGYHARIDKKGANYFLTDLQSTNGTFVNGRRVVSHRLSHGDRISIGRNQLLFIGTEIARIEAENMNVPLDGTVIIGGPKRPKAKASQAPRIEQDIIHQAAQPGHGRTLAIISFVLLLMAGAGFFVSRGAISPFLKGVFVSPEDQAARIRAEADKTANSGDAIDAGMMVRTPQTEEASPSVSPVQGTQPETMLSQDDSPLTKSSEELKPGTRSEEKSVVAASGIPQNDLDIEAIVWSSDGKNSFALINGVELRTGESVDGMTIAEIGRDYVVLRSAEQESTVKLTLQ